MEVLPSVSASNRAARAALITALRRALPAFAGLLIALCAAQVAWRTFQADRIAMGATSGATLMTAPQFFGTTHSGRNFVITGREGRREKTGEAIRLADPVIEMPQGVKGTQRLQARSGLYDASAHSLVLQGDVQMTNASGAELASDQAVIDTQTGEVTARTGLKARSGLTEVTSGGYDIRDRGDRVVFKGGVHARLPGQ